MARKARQLMRDYVLNDFGERYAMYAVGNMGLDEPDPPEPHIEAEVAAAFTKGFSGGRALIDPMVEAVLGSTKHGDEYGRIGAQWLMFSRFFKYGEHEPAVLHKAFRAKFEETQGAIKETDVIDVIVDAATQNNMREWLVRLGVDRALASFVRSIKPDGRRMYLPSAVDGTLWIVAHDFATDVEKAVLTTVEAEKRAVIKANLRHLRKHRKQRRIKH